MTLPVPLILSRVDRVYRKYTVAATDADGAPAAIGGVDVALLPPRTSPTAATGWAAAEADGDQWRVLLAGPDADPTGALVVPAAGADVWLRVTDSPEVDAKRVERITIT